MRKSAPDLRLISQQGKAKVRQGRTRTLIAFPSEIESIETNRLPKMTFPRSKTILVK